MIVRYSFVCFCHSIIFRRNVFFCFFFHSFFPLLWRHEYCSNVWIHLHKRYITTSKWCVWSAITVNQRMFVRCAHNKRSNRIKFIQRIYLAGSKCLAMNYGMIFFCSACGTKNRPHKHEPHAHIFLCVFWTKKIALAACGFSFFKQEQQQAHRSSDYILMIVCHMDSIWFGLLKYSFIYFAPHETTSKIQHQNERTFQNQVILITHTCTHKINGLSSDMCLICGKFREREQMKFIHLTCFVFISHKFHDFERNKKKYCSAIICGNGQHLTLNQSIQWFYQLNHSRNFFYLIAICVLFCFFSSFH